MLWTHKIQVYYFIFPLGGYHNGLTLVSTEIYDISTHTTSPGMDLLAASYDHCTTMDKSSSQLYVIGGMNSNTALMSTGTQVFDLTTRTFTAIAGQLSVGRARLACTILEGEDLLIVAGGSKQGWGSTDSTEILDLTTGTWSNAQSMPMPNYAWAGGLNVFIWNAGKQYKYELAVNEWVEMEAEVFELGENVHNLVLIDTGVYDICPFV